MKAFADLKPATPSRLHDQRTAALLGIGLGVTFSVCFVTGLISHLLQNPQPWFAWPSRPVNLYRFTQGLHVMTGIASIPLLLAKLWVVYPKFWTWPPAKSVTHALERMSLLPLVGGSLFLLYTGVLNIAYWYTPMPFSFPHAHYWAAWLTIGALVVHIGAKIAITRQAVFTRVTPGDVQEPAVAAGQLSRRGFLLTVVAASATLLLSVLGQTVRPLSRLAVLGARRPGVGPQGLPVNKSAAEAGIRDAALDPGWRLVVDSKGVAKGSWSLAELAAMPQRRARLPIACVEGWSQSAEWEGVPLRELLHLAGARVRTVRVESLEQQGLYRTSVVHRRLVADRDTLVALRLDGEPLDLDHGYPVRLIAPNRPGVLQTKWLSRITLS